MDIKQENIGDHQTVINNESGTVNIHQGKQYVDLASEDNLHVYKEISQAEQGKFIKGFIIACLIPAISLIADLMQIQPALNLPIWTYLIVFAAIFMTVAAAFFDNFKIMSSKPFGENECRQLYADRLFKRTENGYVIYTHTDECIYPGCCGKIVISDPPERYNGNYSFFGKCSLAGKQHSYGIDYNFKTYPIEVDWRPIPRPSK